MSRESLVIVLAEDVAQQQFARRCLYLQGYTIHQLRFEKLPSGTGEQWVRERYPNAVSAYRERASRVATAMVTVIDADTGTVAHRSAQLQSALSESAIDARRDQEKIVHLIPKRNIETWVAFLNGRDVNEVDDYKHEVKAEGLQPKSAAQAFFSRSRQPDPPANALLPSLRDGLREWARLA